MRENPIKVAAELGEFLEFTALTAESLSEAVNRTSFDSMQTSERNGDAGEERAILLRSAANPEDIFGDVKTRKGQVGGYSSELQGDTLKFVEGIMKENLDKRLVARFMLPQGNTLSQYLLIGDPQHVGQATTIDIGLVSISPALSGPARASPKVVA